MYLRMAELPKGLNSLLGRSVAESSQVEEPRGSASLGCRSRVVIRIVKVEGWGHLGLIDLDTILFLARGTQIETAKVGRHVSISEFHHSKLSQIENKGTLTKEDRFRTHSSTKDRYRLGGTYGCTAELARPLQRRSHQYRWSSPGVHFHWCWSEP